MRLYNTLTRREDELQPLSSERVTVYTCGPTVYNYLTVGNWVAYVRWDILVRTLTMHGFTPERVMNITDVGHLVSDADDGEDKLEKGAKREGKTAWEVAEFYTADFLEGMKSLNLLQPQHLPKATDFIAQQIKLVQTLEAKGHTYVIDDGVYFDTSTFPTYSEFAKLDLEALRAGARVEFNTQKRNPSDFALWKLTPEGESRDMEWESPWGKGFPGWHLECSAMAQDILGDTLDIHTGGIDHIPVHHTNEIAQSEAASGKRFANIWLHSNFLTVDGTKISKSLNNGYTLQDLASRGFSAMDFRMFVLQSHYRTESNFTWDNLEGAKNRLAHWREIAALRWQMRDNAGDDTPLQDAAQELSEALASDLNTPEALRIVDEVLTKSIGASSDAVEALFQTIDDSLGLQLLDSTPDISDGQKSLLAERSKARLAKDWQRSDELRAEIEDTGIQLNDSSVTTLWYWK